MSYKMLLLDENHPIGRMKKKELQPSHKDDKKVSRFQHSCKMKMDSCCHRFNHYKQQDFLS